MKQFWWIPAALCALAACSGNDESKSATEWELGENNATNNTTTTTLGVTGNNTTTTITSTHNTTTSSTTNTNTVTSNTTNVSCLPSVPERHRSAETMCDNSRAPGNPPDPTDQGVSCMTDADCTDGANGRCGGNGHDGWYCTYDECFADADCGMGATCECGGGFRSDHNVCLSGACSTDADCGETGFCSPTQGSCGAYFGTIGYFCHTCDDECVNDSDCSNAAGDPWGSYCAYDDGVGHWRCSDSQCAG